MPKAIYSWKVPAEGHLLLKAEMILLGVLVFLVICLSYMTFRSWILTVIASVLFIVLFLSVHLLNRKIYPLKEKYGLTSSGISIHSRSGKKISKMHIKHKDIKKVKLDRFMHGGRIETRKGRHPLYFNTQEEMATLEKALKKKKR